MFFFFVFFPIYLIFFFFAFSVGAGQAAGLDANASRWAWVDADGDGHMAAGEFHVLSQQPAGLPPRARWGDSIDEAHVDEAGHLWQRVTTQANGTAVSQIVRYAAAPVLGAHGCPAWTLPAPAVVVPAYPPAPLNRSTSVRQCRDCGRMFYQPARDRLWLADFTLARPQAARRLGIGHEVGSVLCRFDAALRTPAPRAPALCFDLPYFANTSSAPVP